MTETCRIHVVDDDPAMLRMMRDLLAQPGVEVLVYPCAASFLARYAPSPCECLITDLRMPDVGGLALQKRVLERQFSLPVIFFSGYADVASAVEAMKYGAFDFVEKPFDPRNFMDLVQKALVASREAHVGREAQHAAAQRLSTLTARERDIADHIARGLANREVAEQLELSVRTVEHYRARALEKLHVKTAIELARLLELGAQEGYS